MVEKKYVAYNGKGYTYYPCARCLNGTMAWEREKAGIPPYLKCVLCGNETVMSSKKSENLPKETEKPVKKSHSSFKKRGKNQAEAKNKPLYSAISSKLTVQKSAENGNNSEAK